MNESVEEGLPQKMPISSQSTFHEKQKAERPHNLSDFVTHPVFETVMIALILFSAVETALEAQYYGIDTGHILAHPSYSRSAADRWPWAENLFAYFAAFFGFAFTLELLLKMVGLRLSFFCSFFNVYDFIVVGAWLLDYTKLVDMFVSPVALRLVRLARVMRLLRIMRFVGGLDSLHLILASIAGSVSILLWSMAILVVVMVVVSLFLGFAVQGYLLDEQYDRASQLEVYTYFGTFSRSMLSMFEMTIGNWVPVTRVMMENVSEWYASLFIMYQCVVGFAVVKVITGVFLHETFKVAASDDELMIIQKQRLKNKHSQKMRLLLEEADMGGDGKVGWLEFKNIMEEPRVKTWLSAMELDVRDIQSFFDMLDDGDHEIDLNELISGVSRLKGNARSLDMVTLLHDSRRIITSIQSSTTVARQEASDLRQSLQQLEAMVSRVFAGHMPKVGGDCFMAAASGANMPLSARSMPAGLQVPPTHSMLLDLAVVGQQSLRSGNPHASRSAGPRSPPASRSGHGERDRKPRVHHGIQS